MNILCIVFGIIFGLIIMYFVLQPKIHSTKEKDWRIEEQNKELYQERDDLNDEVYRLKNNIVRSNAEWNTILREVDKLQMQEKELKRHIQETRETMEQDNIIIYQKNFDLIQEKLSNAAEIEATKFQQAQEEMTQAYLQVLAEASYEASKTLNEQNEKIAAAAQTISKLKSQIDAAIAANIREEERKNNTTFYTLGIKEIDIQEIEKIRSVLSYIRNPRAINKAIWECYYRNATTDLVNRVIGSRTETGIYKITCLLDNKIYIGQARDLGDRWKQHIKCGLGIDAPSNKLYTAMQHLGVENFSFEVLERCTPEQLNELEKYWIDFYQSNKYGYNMNAGGSRA